MAQDILIVDDEGDIRGLVADILMDEGFETREAATSSEALAAVAARRPSIVLLDIWLQGSKLDGIGILKELRRDHPNLPVLMMSGHGTVETAVSAIKEGAYDFIEKPFKADQLIFLVRRALEAARLKRENAELRLRAGADHQLVGSSSAIKDIDQLIERAAPTNSRVLVSGPSGSGKEVVARLLHERSSRASGPLIIVSCASMTPDRMEEELFGVEPNGVPGRVGTLEQAHGGTLVLDEVADMPLETQGKILRALQDQVFQRVGGTTQVRVDVRVIATASKSLIEEIDQGRFREDLYYRLNVVPISLPPLKERRQDIAELSEYFVARNAEATARPVRRIASDAIAALQAHDWPGNVRELRNVIERMLILGGGADDEPLGVDQLPGELFAASPAGAHLGDGELMSLSLRDARETFEREYLQAQMTKFGGNISKTAEFVGMERSALHRKLRQLGLSGEGKGGR